MVEPVVRVLQGHSIGRSARMTGYGEWRAAKGQSEAMVSRCYGRTTRHLHVAAL